MPGRCFLAFDLPADAVRRLEDARAAIVQASPEWKGEKWVAPHLLHVTLKFIGALDDAAVPPAVDALVAACAPLDRAKLAFVSVRACPSPRRANMLWATMRDADGSAAALARTVDEVLSAAFDVPAPERVFSPHVTLARARRPRRVPPAAIEEGSARLALGQDSDKTMSVRSLTLYSSTLGRDGPTYDALADIPVGSD